MQLGLTIIIAVIVNFNFVWAKTTPQARKGNARWAFVQHDGAMVFSEPNADADVIAYLKAGDRVAISRQPQAGFHRVRLDDNKTGFISIQDISPGSGEGSGDDEKRPGKSAKSSKKSKNPHFNSDHKKDISDNRFVGGFISINQIKEDYANAIRSDRQTFFGLKLSAPDLVSFSPFLTDVNFGFAMAPPSYYGTNAESASGYALWLDMAMLWPLSESRNFMWYVGAGPMLGYVSYKVIASRKINQYDNFRLGLDMLTGFGYRIEKVLVRLDFKYLYDKELYPAVAVSVQHQF